MIRIKRVYDPVDSSDGVRFLVDRLWPRGIKRDALQMRDWLREVAPSDALRRWSHQNPEKWDVFLDRYFADLDQNPDALEPILDAAQRGDVTLLYAARDTERNNAAALKIYLDRKLG